MDYRYTEGSPDSHALYELYDSVQWNDFLKLSEDRLHQAIVQSWYVVNAYDNDTLIGTGRVISDGVIQACVCGVVVHPRYRKQGIGTEIVRKLVTKCRESQLHIQLFCVEDKVSYYQRLGFEVFAVGMKDQGIPF